MPWLVSQGIASNADSDNRGVDWVLRFDFGKNSASPHKSGSTTEVLTVAGQNQAIAEFRTLIDNLQDAGLRVQVRRGNNATLLIFIRVPRDHLGQMIQKSKIQDWLFGITDAMPVGDENTIAAADIIAEETRSVYDAVTLPKESEGAGIVSSGGRWENITASFSLHDQDAYSQILRQSTRKFFWSMEDLDAIRAVFGEKVAFHYAFMQCYSFFLLGPAVVGVIPLVRLGSFSIIYGIFLSIWSVVLLEYWKIHEADLSMRWGVKGVGRLNQKQTYLQERGPRSGQTARTLIPGKQHLTQLLLVPFALVVCIALGSLGWATFAGEAVLSQRVPGALQGYIECLPTIALSILLPFVTALLTKAAAWLTKIEDHHTQGSFGRAVAQKTIVIKFIMSFLPIVLATCLYLLTRAIILDKNSHTQHGPNFDTARADGGFNMSDTQLQRHVFCVSVTAHTLVLCKQAIFPSIKHALFQMRPSDLVQHQHFDSADKTPHIDPPEEASFLRRVCKEAEADEHEVDENTSEKCVQFGYLALFGSICPLISLPTLLTNWLQLRKVFFNPNADFQRPPPVRADSIGPYLQILNFLSQMGAVSTAVIIRIHHSQFSHVDISTLLLTILLAQQAHLAIRFLISTTLRNILPDPLTKEAILIYNTRKNLLESNLSHCGSPGSSGHRARRRVRFNERVNVYNPNFTPSSSSESSPSPETEQPHDEDLKGSDREPEFWNSGSGDPAEDGIELIKTFNSQDDTRLKDDKVE